MSQTISDIEMSISKAVGEGDYEHFPRNIQNVNRNLA